MEAKSTIERVRESSLRALKPALKTSRFLALIIVPVSLAVSALEWCGVITIVAHYLSPVMGFFGLPGESALVLLSSILLNIYSAIAVIAFLDMTPRAITIIALMCLISHNMIVETAVMRKTGTPALVSISLRLLMSVLAAFILNLLLPGAHKIGFATGALTVIVTFPPIDVLLPLLGEWALSTAWLLVKIVFIVVGLMILEKILEEFKIIEMLTKILKPLMVIFGLPESTSFLWIVVNTLGLAYGSAIMIERAESGQLTAKDGDLFNHHAGICHSLLEDTLLFAAIGVSVFWIIVPRLALALLSVWGERLRRILFRRSFEVGTM